jgi:hypothetical protein
MKKRNVAMSLAAGLLGGLISHYAMETRLVHAQNLGPQAVAPTEVRAHRFVLVDEKGQIGGVIGFDTQGAPTIRLYHNGQEIYYAGGAKENPLAQSLPYQEVRAQRFELMNEKGEPAGLIGFDNQGRPNIGLYYDGREIFRAGGQALRPLGR